VNRACSVCSIDFLDTSRSKNRRYCSKRCNTDAGHKRHKEKLAAGIIVKKIDSRDRREERRRRYSSDIGFKLSIVLRTRLSAAVKNNQKTGSAVRDLGCSIKEFKSYLESRWQPGMTWENWSHKGWHIDHIAPISSFDLTDKESLLKACHYTNLQPLWAMDNFIKSDIQHTVYVLAGPSGCGKTTLAKQIEHKFNVIDYDNNTFNKCIELALINSGKPNLIVTPMQAKRIKKILENHGIKTHIVYLRESRDTIVARILIRNGTITPTIDRRINRYESLNNKNLFIFSGPQNEVLDWLLSV